MMRDPTTTEPVSIVFIGDGFQVRHEREDTHPEAFYGDYGNKRFHLLAYHGEGMTVAEVRERTLEAAINWTNRKYGTTTWTEAQPGVMVPTENESEAA